MDNLNDFTCNAWNANAQVWDEKMGDAGNDFFNILCWPALTFLLGVQADSHILDNPNLGFQNGFEERAFPPETPQNHPRGWGGKFSEIPAAIVARIRLPG